MLHGPSGGSSSSSGGPELSDNLSLAGLTLDNQLAATRSLSAALLDGNWNTRREALSTLLQLLADRTEADGSLKLEPVALALAAPLLANLADSKVTIRKSAAAALLAWFRACASPEAAVSAFVQHGLSTNTQLQIQLEALNFLRTPSLWRELPVTAACSLLTGMAPLAQVSDNDELRQSLITTVATAAQALGPATFASRLQQLPAPQQTALRRLLGGDVGDNNATVAPANSSSNTHTEPASPSIIDGRVFGLIDVRQYETLIQPSAADAQARLHALAELQTAVVQLSTTAPLISSLRSLLQCLWQLARETNIKIVVSALQTLSHVSSKAGSHMRQHLEWMLSSTVPLLGDARIVVRQSATKLLNKMMVALGPSPVLSTLLGSLQHDSWRVREELVNVIILSMSNFEAKQLELPLLVKALGPLLHDNKSRVRLVAVEALALLRSLLGQAQLWTLLTAAIDMSADIRQSLEARFASSQLLPTVSQEGLVEHTALPARGQTPSSVTSAPQTPSRATTGYSAMFANHAQSSTAEGSSPATMRASPKLPWSSPAGKSQTLPHSRSVNQTPTGSSAAKTTSTPASRSPTNGRLGFRSLTGATSPFNTSEPSHSRPFSPASSAATEPPPSSLNRGAGGSYAEIFRAKLEGRAASLRRESPSGNGSGRGDAGAGSGSSYVAQMLKRKAATVSTGVGPSPPAVSLLQSTAASTAQGYGRHSQHTTPSPTMHVAASPRQPPGSQQRSSAPNSPQALDSFFNTSTGSASVEKDTPLRRSQGVARKPRRSFSSNDASPSGASNTLNSPRAAPPQFSSKPPSTTMTPAVQSKQSSAATNQSQSAGSPASKKTGNEESTRPTIGKTSDAAQAPWQQKPTIVRPEPRVRAPMQAKATSDLGSTPMTADAAKTTAGVNSAANKPTTSITSTSGTAVLSELKREESKSNSASGKDAAVEDEPSRIELRSPPPLNRRLRGIATQLAATSAATSVGKTLATESTLESSLAAGQSATAARSPAAPLTAPQEASSASVASANSPQEGSSSAEQHSGSAKQPRRRSSSATAALPFAIPKPGSSVRARKAEKLGATGQDPSAVVAADAVKILTTSNSNSTSTSRSWSTGSSGSHTNNVMGDATHSSNAASLSSTASRLPSTSGDNLDVDAVDDVLSQSVASTTSILTTRSLPAPDRSKDELALGRAQGAATGNGASSSGAARLAPRQSPRRFMPQPPSKAQRVTAKPAATLPEATEAGVVESAKTLDKQREEPALDAAAASVLQQSAASSSASSSAASAAASASASRQASPHRKVRINSLVMETSASTTMGPEAPTFTAINDQGLTQNATAAKKQGAAASPATEVPASPVTNKSSASKASKALPRRPPGSTTPRKTTSGASGTATSSPATTDATATVSNFLAHTSPQVALDSSMRSTHRGTVRGGNPGDAYLVSASELSPVEAPFEQVLKQAKACLAKGDNQEQWIEKCEGLELLRRLVIHESQEAREQVRELTQAVMAEVRNLRSSVARLAILTLGDMYEVLGKTMDRGLEETVLCLQNKAGGEASAFIKADVAATLERMVQHTTLSRAVAALLACADHKSRDVRGSTMRLMCDVVQRLSPKALQIKEADRLVKMVARAVSDSDQDTRFWARCTLAQLMECDGLEKLAGGLLTGELKRSFDSAVETIRTKGLEAGGMATMKRTHTATALHQTGASPSTAHGTRRRAAARSSAGASQSQDVSPQTRGAAPGAAATADSASSSAASSRHTSGRATAGHSTSRHYGGGGPSSAVQTPATILGPDGTDLLKDLSRDLAAADWRQRETAVQSLLTTVQQRPADFVGTNLNIFFEFVPRLNDSNSKVSLAALRALGDMLPLVGHGMDTVMAELMPAMAHGLASKAAPIREAAAQVLESTVAQQDGGIIMQPLCTTISTANAVVQEGLVPFFLTAIERAMGDPRTSKLLHRYAVGACAKLSGDKKLQPALAVAWQRLHAELGDGLMKHKAIQHGGNELKEVIKLAISR